MRIMPAIVAEQARRLARPQLRSVTRLEREHQELRSSRFNLAMSRWKSAMSLSGVLKVVGYRFRFGMSRINRTAPSMRRARVSAFLASSIASTYSR